MTIINSIRTVGRVLDNGSLNHETISAAVRDSRFYLESFKDDALWKEGEEQHRTHIGILLLMQQFGTLCDYLARNNFDRDDWFNWSGQMAMGLGCWAPPNEPPAGGSHAALAPATSPEAEAVANFHDRA